MQHSAAALYSLSLYLPIPVCFSTLPLRYATARQGFSARRLSKLDTKNTTSAATRMHSLVALVCLQRAAEVAYSAAHLTCSHQHRHCTSLDKLVITKQASAYRHDVRHRLSVLYTVI